MGIDAAGWSAALSKFPEEIIVGVLEWQGIGCRKTLRRVFEGVRREGTFLGSFIRFVGMQVGLTERRQTLWRPQASSQATNHCLRLASIVVRLAATVAMSLCCSMCFRAVPTPCLSERMRMSRRHRMGTREFRRFVGSFCCGPASRVSRPHIPTACPSFSYLVLLASELLRLLESSSAPHMLPECIETAVRELLDFSL